jgi:transcriptional regulator
MLQGGMTKHEMARFRHRFRQILRWNDKGIPQTEIARRLKMTRQRVNQIINAK